MIIRNTKVETQHPWPEDMFIQGGGSGLVIRSASQGGNYGTAFVEIQHESCGFIRGEGLTVSEAETAAWQKYQRAIECPGHEYEARHWKNGAGACKHCNRFAINVFTPEQLGCLCKKCGVPTFWSRIGDDFFCEPHANDPDTLWLREQRRQAVREGKAETVSGSQLSDFLESLLERTGREEKE